MKHQYADTYEQQIGEALESAGIKFETNQRLDFYLPEMDVYIEVKQYHSDRCISQLASQENIILIQGKKAINEFCKLLNTKPHETNNNKLGSDN